MWLRTTLVRFADGTWELEEFCQSISGLSSRVIPFQTAKQVVKVITLAHDAMVPPEALGFSVHDDVVMPANFPLRPSSQSQSSSASAPSAAAPVRPNVEPPDELPAAAEEAELPVAERPDVDYKSVMVDGVKLDSNTPLRTLRGACESLGLSKTGGKATCLERLWKHLESQELIAAHSAHRDLRGDVSRPVIMDSHSLQNQVTLRRQSTISRTIPLPSGVSFVLQIDHSKMVILNNITLKLHIAVFLLILVMQVEGMMMTSCALYLFMTGVQGLCMWYQRHKREADTSTICALNFVVSLFGVAMIQ